VVVPPGNSRILASRIPGAQLVLIPGLGHRAIWETPEEISDLVTDFLEPDRSGSHGSTASG
jgi:pimeloyl-ACP methyl ester carboxylesterase